jgi:hypothetical protein
MSQTAPCSANNSHVMHVVAKQNNSQNGGEYWSYLPLVRALVTSTGHLVPNSLQSLDFYGFAMREREQLQWIIAQLPRAHYSIRMHDPKCGMQIMFKEKQTANTVV